MKTYDSYEFVLRIWAGTLEPHTLHDEVGPDDVRGYIYREDVSRATQRHSYRHLRAFFNWAQREQLIKQNPIGRIDPPRVESKQMPFIAPEEMGKILKAADDQLPAFFLALAYRVALGAGLRRDEIRYLQPRGTNLDYDYLVVRSKEVAGTEVLTKGRTDRRVPLNRLSRKALKRALAGREPDDLLIAEKGRLVTKDRHSKALTSLLKDKNVHLPKALHSLRGHYLTYMLLLDWPVPLVQALVDHKDPNVTYGYLRDVQSMLFGDTRQRFRDKAIKLGFEPYQMVPVGPQAGTGGTA